MTEQADGRRWLPAVQSLLNAASYLLFGIIAGVIGTFGHRTRIFVGESPIWLGCVVALAATFLIALGLRWYLDEWLPPVMFLVGVVLAVYVLSTPGGGRSVLFPAGELTGPGLWWMYGSALAAGLPLMVPKIRRHRPDAHESTARAGMVEDASATEKETAS